MGANGGGRRIPLHRTEELWGNGLLAYYVGLVWFGTFAARGRLPIWPKKPHRRMEQTQSMPTITEHVNGSPLWHQTHRRSASKSLWKCKKGSAAASTATTTLLWHAAASSFSSSTWAVSGLINLLSVGHSHQIVGTTTKHWRLPSPPQPRRGGKENGLLPT